MPRERPEEAEPCPECGADILYPCVYLPSQNDYRLNQPTAVRSHNGRLVAHWRAGLLRKRREEAAALRSWILLYGHIFEETS